MDILGITLGVTGMFAVMPSYNIDDPNSPKHAIITHCSSAARLDRTIYFGAQSIANTCLYFTLSQEEAATLGEKLIEWAKDPYISHNIYRKDLP